MQVLKLDRNCEDAMTELLRVRTYQLTVSQLKKIIYEFCYIKS